MIFGRIATAGTSASTAAAKNAHHGIAGAASASAFAASLNVATPTATQSAAMATTASGENPISKKIGSVAALWTAQPMTGAAPIASARGKRWRVSA